MKTVDFTAEEIEEFRETLRRRAAWLIQENEKLEAVTHPDPSLTHNGEDNILGPLTPIQILLLKDPLFLLVMRLLIPTPYHRFSVRAKPKRIQTMC